MNTDIRNLTKWLNEGQEAPLDRQALARVLAMSEQPARQALQAAGTHPAPCARHCEAQAFEIAARGMRRQIAELQAALAEQPAQQQEPVVFYRCNGCGHAYEQVHPTSCDCMEAGGFDRVEYYTYPQAQPAQQEPVAVPTTSYEHRKFVLVGRDWYERFAAFHDDCQIGEQLTWQEKTIRQQGYENGWNDAQRYLKEPQSTSPTPAQQEPVAWMYQCSADSSGPVLMQNKRDWAESSSGLWTETPLYKSPPAQRKPWVGLTDEELELLNDCGDTDSYQFARAIEAKLKEKNA